MGFFSQYDHFFQFLHSKNITEFLNTQFDVSVHASRSIMHTHLQQKSSPTMIAGLPCPFHPCHIMTSSFSLCIRLLKHFSCALTIPTGTKERPTPSLLPFGMPSKWMRKD